MQVFKNILPLGMLLLLVFCLGCENQKNSSDVYQLMQSEDGRLYRLNKETGQIVVLEGTKIIPMEVERRKTNTADQVISSEAKENNSNNQNVEPVSQELPDKIIPKPIPIRQLKQWHDEQLNGKNLKISFQSSWENNRFFYIVEAHPYSSLKLMLDKKEEDIYYQRKWHGFIIRLLDANNETVKDIPVRLWDMAKILDENGKFSSLKAEAEIDLFEDEYIRITGYKVVWKLDNILIPEYKFKNKVDDLIDTYSWYGEVDPRVDANAPSGAKYWWITFPDKKKIYFSTEEELLKSYQATVEKILEANQ
ncbi:MAG: hypothetical protein KJ915_10215 [Candidatus Omnitrophica bacterium]|nr:hypothetical protein [Candidatus Omnitrophota bacterium]